MKHQQPKQKQDQDHVPLTQRADDDNVMEASKEASKEDNRMTENRTKRLSQYVPVAKEPTGNKIVEPTNISTSFVSGA